MIVLKGSIGQEDLIGSHLVVKLWKAESLKAVDDGLVTILLVDKGLLRSIDYLQ